MDVVDTDNMMKLTKNDKKRKDDHYEENNYNVVDGFNGTWRIVYMQ